MNKADTFLEVVRLIQPGVVQVQLQVSQPIADWHFQRVGGVKLLRTTVPRPSKLLDQVPGGQSLVTGSGLFAPPAFRIKVVIAGLHQPVDFSEGRFG
ncbi:MAG TPA: hypothetical protein PKE64_29445 [Anaerolineae bacterium]|nr:hypothetical protein [Anaerolineae bacterium]